jgi:arylsulfatase A-like enzyme/Tfp pilus assembly protein PilF
VTRTRPASRSRLPLVIAAALAVAAAAAAFFAGLGRPRSWRAGSWQGRNIVLVTVDTLRADRLPAYGEKNVRTPAIDALAARGTVFERCVSATPLTLPSHTTILSGALPPRHGVRDNGAFNVPAELPLLPEILHARGWATGAFVGAFVLDSRWGLARGFDRYFDQFDTRRERLVSIGDIERPGSEVIDAALAWLAAADPKKPFFLWVHLYDPHAPYAPPPPFDQEYAEHPYLGEIAYVDSQLARLFVFLDERKLSGSTAVVLTGDHGEGLGEHEENGHGLFVYQQTLHVPLIVAAPGAAKPVRRAEVVSLADVTPTLLDLAGAPIPASADGHSLRPLLAGERALEERPAYSETYYPRFHFAWSDLESLQDGRWKMIESSDPELYDLAADPDEARNLAASQRDRYLAMRRQLETLRERWRRTALNARPAVQDPESVRKLASLGYLTGGSDPARAEGPLPSPRAKIGLYNLLNSASALAPVDPAGAEKMLRQILAEDPNVVDARARLANVCLAQGRVAEAVPLLETAVRERPADVSLALALASALEATGRGADAARFLETRVSGGLEDGRLDFLLGTLAEKRGDRVGADSWFERAASREPRSAARRSAMAELLLARGDLAGAAREASAALELDPRVAGAHWVLARAAEARGRAADAVNEYGAEIALDASNERSFGALGAAARRLGRLDSEAELLAESMRRHPEAVWPRLYGSRNLLDRGDLANGVRLAEEALSLSPNDRQSAFACFLLADLYSRLGDTRRSEDFARKAKGFASRAGAA